MMPTLEKLRKVLPRWSWTALRDAAGWRYRGTRDDREVLVRLEPAPDEGHLATRWVVDEPGDLFPTRPFSMFFVSEIQ